MPVSSARNIEVVFDQEMTLVEQVTTICQGRNMVYPGPTDPYFLSFILIPGPHFPQNFDP